MIAGLGLAILFSNCQPTAEPANTSEEAPDTVPPLAKEIPDKPPETNQSDNLIPDGVLISTGNEASLTYLNENGQVMNEFQTPGIISVDREDVAIAGMFGQDASYPPIIYHSWLPDQGLMININGSVGTLRQTPSFFAIAGSPGQPAAAFSEVIINTDNNPESFLYAGNLENLGEVGYFYNLVDEPYYWALKPVGIQTVSGEAQGVWYVKSAWGIGGADLIFPINRGLYFFDLTNGDNTQYLGDDRSYQGISPDLSHAASVEISTEGKQEMTVHNLSNQQETEFALDQATDRGAGFAVFSPDNQYVAWLEATGSMISDPYDFHPRVRVGDTQSGGVVQSVEDQDAVQMINGNMLTMMQPAGWLNNETLLIEVRGENWDDVTLLRFDITNGTLSAFSSGSFISFGYQ